MKRSEAIEKLAQYINLWRLDKTDPINLACSCIAYCENQLGMEPKERPNPEYRGESDTFYHGTPATIRKWDNE